MDLNGNILINGMVGVGKTTIASALMEKNLKENNTIIIISFLNEYPHVMKDYVLVDRENIKIQKQKINIINLIEYIDYTDRAEIVETIIMTIKKQLAQIFKETLSKIVLLFDEVYFPNIIEKLNIVSSKKYIQIVYIAHMVTIDMLKGFDTILSLRTRENDAQRFLEAFPYCKTIPFVVPLICFLEKGEFAVIKQNSFEIGSLDDLKINS